MGAGGVPVNGLRRPGFTSGGVVEEPWEVTEWTEYYIPTVGGGGKRPVIYVAAPLCPGMNIGGMGGMGAMGGMGGMGGFNRMGAVNPMGGYNRMGVANPMAGMGGVNRMGNVGGVRGLPIRR